MYDEPERELHNLPEADQPDDQAFVFGAADDDEAPPIEAVDVADSVEVMPPVVPVADHADAAAVETNDRAAEPAFEDLTLAQALSQMWYAPRDTIAGLIAVAQTPVEREPTGPFAPAYAGVNPSPSAALPPSMYERYMPAPAAPIPAAPAPEATIEQDESAVNWVAETLQLMIRFLAFGVALWGNFILANTPGRAEEIELVRGLPFLAAGFVIWLASELIGVRWGDVFSRRKPLNERIEPQANARPITRSLIATRLTLVAVGLVFSGLAAYLNWNNHFTLFGFAAWMLSIIVWAGALAERDWNYGRAVVSFARRAGQFRLRWSWTAALLIVIMLLAAYFRFAELPRNPPEMTSDHVEKVLDADRVSRGVTNVFFANNGGREPAQMYFLAVLGQFPGLGMNFFTLKFATALEGLVAVLLMFWVGRAVIGPSQRNLGTIVGLVLAALVAASYWHTALSRLGLRIVLTTVIAAALLIVLSRALRFNRRNDYILAGLILGFGLYMYQAVRMLPVVIIVGVGIAFLFYARGWRARRDYVVNFIVLVLMSFIVFVPMFAYSVQYPEDFWRRTAGRLLGDAVITETDASGNIVERDATFEERLEAFNNNVPILMSNIRNALLMFNWKGDVAWINGAPNHPAMSTIAGAFLILGLAAWLARIVRRRDPVDILIPLMVFIMLLPSALSIAYPVENPSHTRTSGALPPVYLLAAFPIALMARSVMRLLPGRIGAVIATLAVSALIYDSFRLNADVYFNDYRESYLISALPYSEVGDLLEDFGATHGYGNAFMVAYPYWWDHRALGIEAEHVLWPNGLVTLDQLPREMYYSSREVGPYRFDVDSDIMIFYAPADIETEQQLREWFPDGFPTEQQSYQPEDYYRIFYVPALGSEGFQAFIEEHFDTVG